MEDTHQTLALGLVFATLVGSTAWSIVDGAATKAEMNRAEAELNAETLEVLQAVVEPFLHVARDEIRGPVMGPASATSLALEDASGGALRFALEAQPDGRHFLCVDRDGARRILSTRVARAGWRELPENGRDDDNDGLLDEAGFSVHFQSEDRLVIDLSLETRVRGTRVQSSGRHVVTLD